MVVRCKRPLGMNLMTKLPLSEAETVAMLERMCVELRSATGATATADSSIRTSLGALERIMGMAIPFMDTIRREPPPAMEIVPVLLIREALENLNAYQREQRPHSTRAETISFILGQYLRQVGYFGKK